MKTRSREREIERLGICVSFSPRISVISSPIRTYRIDQTHSSTSPVALPNTLHRASLPRHQSPPLPNTSRRILNRYLCVETLFVDARLADEDAALESHLACEALGPDAGCRVQEPLVRPLHRLALPNCQNAAARLVPRNTHKQGGALHTFRGRAVEVYTPRSRSGRGGPVRR